MASSLPTELWFSIISHLSYEDSNFRLKYVNKYFHHLICEMTIHRLPLHLWEKVFEYLDYIALLRVGSLCKSFRGRIEYSKSQKIKVARFREPLVPPNLLPPHTKFTLHPIIESLRVHETPARAFTRKRYHTPEDGSQRAIELSRLRLDKHPAMLENITSPPIELYQLSNWQVGRGSGYGGSVEIPKPVTVYQVIHHVMEVVDASSSGGYITALTQGLRSLIGGRTHLFRMPGGVRDYKFVEYGAAVLFMYITDDVLHVPEGRDDWSEEEEQEEQEQEQEEEEQEGEEQEEDLISFFRRMISAYSGH
ncbi:hypothetical protein TWF730_007106 [Orbilia blumenaviensis]|uniref:F-box domain-containing protein n=1 Tax=Orbilia blumenaviensis TaxID=1796055 RepID=A0AAV9VG95_9PEZI